MCIEIIHATTLEWILESSNCTLTNKKLDNFNRNHNIFLIAYITRGIQTAVLSFQSILSLDSLPTYYQQAD